MKKLLFLYPIEEYMQFICRHNHETYDLMNEIIQKRYREKGYTVYFLTFKGKPVFGINVSRDDVIIEGNISFEEHTNPIGENSDGKKVYEYTSNTHVKELLGDFNELVVCGFHAQDCVMRVADYFYGINQNTMVDEELTDFLNTLSRRFYFEIGEYNLANKLLYDKAEDMLMYKKPFMTKFSHYVERYKNPYMKAEKFSADFTLEECMNKLLQEYEEKMAKSRKN